MEKLRFDLYYIRFYSPLLDLEIILKTVFHVLTLRGR
jgi:lipopolysaccharide/colanic/teichoic acid biosynthesis glycosyltransferase